MQTTAIILLNWNGRKLLERFLPAVTAFSGNEGVRVIVADNGSTDDSAAFVKAAYPSVEVLTFGRNYGFTGGYNKAIEEIEADFVVLLNTDVEVTEGWLDEPLRLLAENKDVSAVQPKIRSLREREKFEYAGAAGGFIDRWGFPFCRGRILSSIENDRGQYDNSCEVFWASGACMFVRRAAFIEAGGFDPLFFAHQEEIDICWRWKNQGYKILYTPLSTVFHLGAATLDASNPRKTFLNFKNNRLMLYKNLPGKELRKVLFVRFWFDAAAWVSFLFSGKWRDAWAIVKAYRVFRREKKSYRIKKEVKRTFSAYPQVYPASIISAYYLQGKRTFPGLLSQRKTGNFPHKETKNLGAGPTLG